MMRSLSSCLDETRIWRSTERARLEKKPSTRLSQEPCFGLPGDMRGMIVEDEVDRGVGRIGFVETLEEGDELAAAMAVLDHGVNLAGDKVDAGQQGDRAVAPVFMVAGEGRMNAGLGRQIGGRRCNRLNTGLFVVGDNRHPVVRLSLRPRRGL